MITRNLPRISKRTTGIEQAEIRLMSIECERYGGINLAQGVCDTEVPDVVRRAAKAGIEQGFNSYTRSDGLSELRNAIAQKVADYNNIKANPETEIVVSAGSTGAFYCTCLALLDPGDEVVLFEPYYGYHENTLLAVGAIPRFVHLLPPAWSFDPQELERVVNHRTKAIIINTPANPSGKVFSREEIRSIASIAEQKNLFVFTDEIYEHFLYDGAEHVSPGSLSEIADRTITISGFSKSLSITGWRIGYSVSHKPWAERINQMNDLIYVCSPAPLQVGVARGLSEIGDQFYRDLSATYSRKRDRICQTLRSVGLFPHVPQGAYYVLADTSSLPGASSKEKAMYLLERSRVACVPGDSFFSNGGGRDLARFCFAKSDEELERACRSIEESLR